MTKFYQDRNRGSGIRDRKREMTN